MARMRDQRGFSLPEVMAALLILTFIITVSFAAFLERNRRLQQASEIMLAWQALANEAEFQRRVPYINLADSDEFESDTSLLAPLEPFTTTITVEEGDQLGVSWVTMSIEWRKGERSEQLTLIRVDTGGTALW
jgi:prepilin-type N-terminal cleavage/methylation domain-containing protein